MCAFCVCLTPSTPDANWACNKTFRSRPECLRKVLCTFRMQAVPRAGIYA